uniref:Serine/threonine-protein kinase PLK n=1 Tax=Panagrellus redivivus TaxID=6233 RepID=A0A7E4VY55_PANRE
MMHPSKKLRSGRANDPSTSPNRFPPRKALNPVYPKPFNPITDKMFKKPDPKQHAQVPELVIDEKDGSQFKRGKFLGKGGFARCYELRDSKDEVWAAKVIPKAMLQKTTHKEKFVNEIDIHQSVSHAYIVKILKCVSDSNNMYILMELCSNRSLMELQKRRSYVTEPEARYFLKQIVSAVCYLHSNLIIHRDLKLGNVFIDGKMKLKVGDFGLATRLKNADERKDTLCGTPNYIAPEMLQHRKHSFEVDVWATGCILYTLLCGHPPFETTSLTETYNRIKSNQFTMPRSIGAYAAQLIRDLLQNNEFNRPKIDQVKTARFFYGYCPESLPVSALECVPKIEQELEGGDMDCSLFAESIHVQGFASKPAAAAAVKLPAVRNPLASDRNTRVPPSDPKTAKVLLHSLLEKLKSTEIKMKHPAKWLPVDIFAAHPNLEAESPNLTPSFFVSKWVDYSDKYGLGYQLAEGTVGVLFNDASSLLCDQDFEHIMYAEHGREVFFKSGEKPKELNKKMVLLQYFVKYMHDQLITASAHSPESAKKMSRPPCLISWFRTDSAIVLHLSTGLVQVNFFKDHSKFIFDGSVDAVTIICADRSIHTYKFDTVIEYGASEKLQRAFGFAIRVHPKLLQRADDNKPRGQ